MGLGGRGGGKGNAREARYVGFREASDSELFWDLGLRAELAISWVVLVLPGLTRSLAEFYLFD